MKKLLTLALALCALCTPAFAQEPITTPTFLGAYFAGTQTIANGAAVSFPSIDFSNHITPVAGNRFQVDFTGKYQVEFLINPLAVGSSDSASGTFAVAVNNVVQTGTDFRVNIAGTPDSHVFLEAVAIVVVPNDGGTISIVNQTGAARDTNIARINIKRIGKGPNP